VEQTADVVALVILGLVLGAAGALLARVAPRWRLVGAVIAAAGLALVVYELVFCDC
jgi:hypothetical protein